MFRRIAAPVLLLVAGCAANSKYAGSYSKNLVLLKDYTEQNGELAGVGGDVDGDDALFCDMEAPTGTRVARRVCRSEPQAALVRGFTRDWMFSLRRGTNGGPSNAKMRLER